jgi:hypothetical protein
MPEERRKKRKKTENVLRPEYEKALKQSMKEFDALLKRLAKL